jgi:hypothetical protein
MLQGLINRAQLSLDQMVARYLTRAVVAIPFLIAAGFAVTALLTYLTALYGAINAYLIVAIGFAILGLLTAAFTTALPVGPVSTPIETSPSVSGTESVTAEADKTLENLMMAAGAVGPVALPVLFRSVVRNLPLILVIGALAYLLFGQKAAAEPNEDSHGNRSADDVSQPLGKSPSNDTANQLSPGTGSTASPASAIAA